MAWFNALSRNVNNFLTMENRNKVLDVVAQDFSHRNIQSREDSLVLYTPNNSSKNYELVLHRPYNESLTEAYSLCRCIDSETAQGKFLLYKDKLPTIVSIRKDLYNSAQIQKLCDMLSEHPGWNLAHVVVRLGLTNLISNNKVRPFINVEEAETGLSPLQLAIQDQNIKMVQELLNNNASLNHFDNDCCSVLHYAASTNKQIVNLLCKNSKITINSRNAEGRTPLHVACYADKRDCVHALLEAGADVNISVTERRSSLLTPGCVGSIKNFPQKLHGDDIKYGGTPLHWACSREVIEALVCKNCDINSLNFDQRTALHVMVLRNRLDCLVTLLSFSADCNIGDKDGNSPLHLAVKENNEACVKALIVFGADTSYLNNNGETLRHLIDCESEIGGRILYILHSVGAPRCSNTQTSCNRGCKYDESFIGITPSLPVFPARDYLDSLLSLNTPDLQGKKGGKLLCLDGGGIRGLVLIVMLMELEKYFDRPIYECFDWIAGTSTGGILALAVATKKPLIDCLCLYFKLKDNTFCGKRPYDAKKFENILKETFGKHTTMATIKSPKVMITSTVVDHLPVDLHIFRNYASPSEILNVPYIDPLLKPCPPHENYLWKVARATGAAPTYFRASGKYLDGGLISNNPTLDALTEVEELNVALTAVGLEEEVLKVNLVVSLGTGIMPLQEVKGEVDIFRPSNLWDAGKFLFGVTTMAFIIMDQATQAEGRVVDRARSWCFSAKIPYYRYSPQLSQSVDLDETSNEVLTNMLWETKAYMHSKAEELKKLANILKDLS